MVDYIGITIGPIIDMLSAVSKPAGLWGASYLYSFIAKKICETLISKGIPKENFVSPYFEMENDKPNSNNGDNDYNGDNSDNGGYYANNDNSDNYNHSDSHCFRDGSENSCCRDDNVKIKIKNASPGVGLFHDRIFFQVRDEKSRNNQMSGFVTEKDAVDVENKNDLEIVKESIDIVVEYVGEQLANGIKDKNDDPKCIAENLDHKSELEQKRNRIISYVRDYLQIYAIKMPVMEQKNPIRELSPFLDALELEKRFPQRSLDPYFLTLLDNDTIKDCFLMDDFGGFKYCPVAERNDKKPYREIRQIESIARGEQALPYILKRTAYYAIVQADGDNIGEVLKGITDNNKLMAFSRNCFNYAIDSVREIINFGAVPIYAGGDDLLFLTPLQSTTGETIFGLLKKIRASFVTHFSEYYSPDASKSDNAQPSVSFGIAIHYVKYPLYEALSNARYQLFDVAKKTENKNATAIRIQKHSGQSFGWTIEAGDKYNVIKSLDYLLTKPFSEKDGKRKQLSDDIDELKQLSDDVDEQKLPSNESDKQVKFFSSVLHTLYLHRALFTKAINQSTVTAHIADNSDALHHLFLNIFDSEIHQDVQYLQEIETLLRKIVRSGNSVCRTEGIEKKDDDKYHPALKVLDSMLRMISFYREKGEEE